MDGALLIGILAGMTGTVGAVGKVLESISTSRSSGKNDEGRLRFDEKVQESSDAKWMVEELKAERAALKVENAELVAKLERKNKEHADQVETMRTEHERLQLLFRDAIDRLESCQMEHPPRSI